MAISKSRSRAEEFRRGIRSEERTKTQDRGKEYRRLRGVQSARFDRTVRSGADEDQSSQDFHQRGRHSLLKAQQSDVDHRRGYVHPKGRHDLQKGMCSRKRFEMVAQGQSKRVFAEGVDINPKKAEEIPDHGCWENLSSRGQAVEDCAGRRAESVQYFSVHAHRS